MNAVVEPRRHKLSVDDYIRLGEAGILPEDARIELIEGDLIDMPPIGTGHASVDIRLTPPPPACCPPARAPRRG